MILSYLAAFSIACLAWQCFGDYSKTVRLFLSTPKLSVSYALVHRNALLQDVITTGIESIFGLVLAVACSIALMILCLYFPRLFSWLFPIMLTSQVIPLVTLAPLFILLFGLGVSSKVAMASLLCFFPTFIGFARGVNTIDRGTLELVRLYAINRTFRIFHVFMPMSLPYLMTGVRVSAALSVIGAIVGEFNGAEHGLGRNLFLAARRLEPELTVCSVALSAILGGLLYLLVIGVERVVAPWYQSSRSDINM
jgi:NitT/TauT family transport system permease protein